MPLSGHGQACNGRPGCRLVTTCPLPPGRVCSGMALSPTGCLATNQPNRLRGCPRNRCASRPIGQGDVGVGAAFSFLTLSTHTPWNHGPSQVHDLPFPAFGGRSRGGGRLSRPGTAAAIYRFTSWIRSALSFRHGILLGKTGTSSWVGGGLAMPVSISPHTGNAGQRGLELSGSHWR